MSTGGYGGGGYGNVPWGASDSEAPAVIDAIDGETIVESLTVSLPLKLISAVALSLTEVELTFSHALDTGYAPTTAPNNYTITPTLGISSVVVYSAKVVRLHTAFQSDVVYTITVGTERSTGTDLLDPSFDTLTFNGFKSSPVFQAAAQGIRKVMLTFSQPMQQDANLADPSKYSIKAVYGTTVAVVAVQIQDSTHVTLTLGSDLSSGQMYVAETDITIVAATGATLAPRTDLFRWAGTQTIARGRTLTIPTARFSGEVSGGLFGTPAGQVFFSPALQAPIAGSQIQIDSVQACTRAYDVYSMPSPPDPTPFLLWAPNVSAGALNSLETVLWAPPEVLGLAAFGLSDSRSDTAPATDDDDRIYLEMVTPIVGSGGILNDPGYGLFDGVTTPFTIFDNTAPASQLTQSWLLGTSRTFTVFPTDVLTVQDTIQTLGGTKLITLSTDAAIVADTGSWEKSWALSDTVAVGTDYAGWESHKFGTDSAVMTDGIGMEADQGVSDSAAVTDSVTVNIL